jgi:hypothetical protein
MFRKHVPVLAQQAACVNEEQHKDNTKENSVAVKHTEAQLEENRLLRQPSLHMTNACQYICRLVALFHLQNLGFIMATVGCIHPCLPHH